MSIDIRSDYKLTGKVNRVRTAVRDYMAYFETQTDKKDIDKKIKELEPAIKTYMNGKLEEGMELPLPNWLTSLTTNPRFR